MDLVFLIVILIVLVGTSLLYFIVSMIIGAIYFRVVFLRRPNDANFKEEEDPAVKYSPERNWLWSNEIEEITLTSKDKLKLKGYYINNNSNKLVILVHGYHGRYYSMTKQAKFLYEDGYDLLLINNRCHDTSEGKWFSMGKYESRDLLEWINLMIKRNSKYKISLFGVSMGAHIVMMMEGYSLPINVVAMIEDSGYSSLYTQMYDSYIVGKKPLPHYVTHAASMYASILHNFSFRNDTKNAFKKADIPMLLMHGDKDSIVPYYNLDKNFDLLPSSLYKEKVSFKGEDHLMSVHNQYDLYKDKVLSFLREFNK